MERDESVGKDLEEINKRLNRHRFNIDSCHSWEKDVWAKVSLLDDKRMELEAKVMAMEERLCHCGDRSAARSPSPLEYATPDSSVVGTPRENASPLPVPSSLPPADNSLPPSSDQENIPPRGQDAPAFVGKLIAIDQMSMVIEDQEVRRQILNQRCKRRDKKVLTHPYRPSVYGRLGVNDEVRKNTQAFV